MCCASFGLVFNVVVNRRLSMVFCYMWVVFQCCCVCWFKQGLVLCFFSSGFGNVSSDRRSSMILFTFLGGFTITVFPAVMSATRTSGAYA